MLKKRNAFTLIEVLTAITILGLISISIATIFISIQRGWQRQRVDLEVVQNCRWAIDSMINQIRQGTDVTEDNPQQIYFILDINGDNIKVWYWRDGNIVYRGTGTDINQANENRQELANFITDNPSENPLFNYNAELLTIELTTAKEGRTYTLRSAVKPRN